MKTHYPEYTQLDLAAVQREVLTQWEAEETFAHSLAQRADAPAFVFYEGPPSANGLPGIHHVMARTLKDALPVQNPARLPRGPSGRMGYARTSGGTGRGKRVGDYQGRHWQNHHH